MEVGAARETVRETVEVEAARERVREGKAASELLSRLQDSLSRAANKNDSLLEAIESTEARAGSEAPAGEVSLRP